MAQSPVRASDVDRERVAAILRGAAGKGLLTLAEVDERLGRVYAAIVRRAISRRSPPTCPTAAAGSRRSTRGSGPGPARSPVLTWPDTWGWWC